MAIIQILCCNSRVLEASVTKPIVSKLRATKERRSFCQVVPYGDQTTDRLIVLDTKDVWFLAGL